VLTTWQHHFIDLPTGLAAGLFCLWLWPETAQTPLKKGEVVRPALAVRYFAGAALTLAAALALGGLGLILGWVALALALVAFNYAWAGAAGFQKNAGRHSLAACWLFAPYTFGAWINSRLWTWRHPAPDRIADGLWLGRLPTAREFAAWAEARGGKVGLFDLTAELPAPALPGTAVYDNFPCLDLASIPAHALTESTLRIERLRSAAPEIWIACALGCARSAIAVAAWAYQTGRTATAEDALALLRRSHPQIALGPETAARFSVKRGKAASL
jgi:protein-tyrosine phosphatase